jgi:hypothetical protein
MRTVRALLLLSVASLVACSGAGVTIGDGGTTPTDDGAAPTDDGGATEDVPPSPTGRALVEDLTLSEIAVYQGVKIPVMQGGTEPTRKAPIVASRPGLLRVFVTRASSWQPKPVQAFLVLDNTASGGKVETFDLTQTPSSDSTDADLGSTFNFDLPAAVFKTTTKYQVVLTDPARKAAPSTTPSAARWPEDGSFADLGAKSSGPQLKITLVPIAYGADGSGRLPDTSATQLGRYRQIFMDLYPIADVQFTVRNAVTSNTAVSPNGSGFGSMLNLVTNLRAQDGVANDVYYYGIFSPAPSFAQFCGGGCVSGLSTIGQANQPSTRVGTGLGFTGLATTYTAAHEVGHAHGRPHAPCGGAQGIDPNYPTTGLYAGGGIGTWGYAILEKSLVAPSGAMAAKDMMGYCDPSWISDYNFNLLFQRIATVNGASMQPGAPRTFRLASVDEKGGLVWGERVTVTYPVEGEPRTLTVVRSDGTTDTVTGQYFPYDHLAGGQLWVPDVPFARASLTLGLRRFEAPLPK